MSSLGKAVDEYLELRRAVGFKLEREARLLPDFVAYLDRRGARTVTVELALAWAKQPADGQPAWWGTRLRIVRCFAKHLQAIDPRTEIPASDLLPYRRRRAPYLYSDQEIARLVEAAEGLCSPLNAATYATLVGLLATTGMRVGEAVRLDRPDMDWIAGVLLIRDSKFGKSREVPLHETTVEALRTYARLRDRRLPRLKAASFFISTTGTRLIPSNVDLTFLTLLDRAGIESRSPHARPRPHDLRHTFATRTLLEWYRAGADVQARLPLLSTYLGHVAPRTTYWYLTATPDLLEAVRQCVERRREVQS